METERGVFPDIDPDSQRIHDLEKRVGELEEDQIEIDQLWAVVLLLGVVAVAAVVLAAAL